MCLIVIPDCCCRVKIDCVLQGKLKTEVPQHQFSQIRQQEDKILGVTAYFLVLHV